MKCRLMPAGEAGVWMGTAVRKGDHDDGGGVGGDVGAGGCVRQCRVSDRRPKSGKLDFDGRQAAE